MNIRTAMLLVGLGFGLWGCQDQGQCLQGYSTGVRTTFSNTDDEAEDDRFFIRNLVVLESDLTVQTQISATAALWPVDPLKDTVVYSLESDRGVDTLRFIYSRRLRLVGADCGLEQAYDDLIVQLLDSSGVQLPITTETLKNFDSLDVVSTSLLESEETHLLFYFQ